RVYVVRRRGRDIAFGAGQYAPESNEGQRLLAHELAHTIQQGASKQSPARFRSVRPDISPGRDVRQIQRQPNKAITGGKLTPNPKCPKGASAAGSTAAGAAKFDVTSAKNGAPCACLLVIHNNEENARKTAELMHQHCAYNLALVLSGGATRCVRLPGHGAENFDPNEFFDPEIVKQCVNDEALCRNFLTTKSGTTDRAEIDRFVQIKFYLAVKDCSNSFSLPVIALHNNAIEDTKDYQKGKAGKDVKDLKLDIAKGKKEDDEKNIKPLKEALKKKFDEATQKALTDIGGKTNIFRWCASEELSRCHIGDPDRPDHVIWVTNKKDFDELSKKDVNVVLQDDPSRVGKESQTDLSTLFLSLKDIMGAKLDAEITRLQLEIGALAALYVKHLLEVTNIIIKGVTEGSADHQLMIVLHAVLDSLFKQMTARRTAIEAVKKEKERFGGLRFINIETPLDRLASQTDVGRKESYEFIVASLRAIGLHCCGGKEAEAEAKVKEGLTLKRP
ncbi:MAG TPA: DUF4157 domain-containing protein, partial [Pyrinomonadaceae bacterium]|nr:DUF4157 domain-containing protein [Pyrinomonadaceae bacterium]